MDRWEVPLKEAAVVLNEALSSMKELSRTILRSKDRQVHVHERLRPHHMYMSDRIRPTYERAECVVLHEVDDHSQGRDFQKHSGVEYVITASGSTELINTSFFVNFYRFLLGEDALSSLVGAFKLAQSQQRIDHESSPFKLWSLQGIFGVSRMIA